MCIGSWSRPTRRSTENSIGCRTVPHAQALLTHNSPSSPQADNNVGTAPYAGNDANTDASTSVTRAYAGSRATADDDDDIDDHPQRVLT